MSIDMLTPMDLYIIGDDAWAITTIWQEIRNGRWIDMVMVAEVIRDRTRLKYNSLGTVADTCLRPEQFSGWDTYDRNRVMSDRLRIDDPIVKMCADAWRMANKSNTSYARGAVLYHAVSIPLPSWAKLDTTVKVVQTEFHIFYKDMKVQK